MKSQVIPRTGIMDAMTAGLTEAARRPWLWIVPIAIDLVLWLAPRLSITALSEQLMAAWRALLPMIYTPQQMAGAKEGLDLLQAGIVAGAQNVNLGGMLTSGWLAPPSAVTAFQATRYLLISDAVLAPVGLGLELKPLGASPWQQPAVQISSLLGVISVVVVLWVISHLLMALYFRIVAHTLAGASGPSTLRAAQAQRVAGLPDGELPAARQPVDESELKLLDGWLPLAWRFAAVSLFASIATFMLRLPLILVTALAVFSGSGAAQFLFVFGGGITLWLTMWFLSSLFFVGDALAFEHQLLWPSLMQSLILVRGNGFRALILAAIVNVLMLGARAVWGILGGNPAGALLAIVVNGYLATAMTIGIYVYYKDLRRHWQAAQLGRQLSK